MLNLSNRELLRHQAYIGGQWCDSESGGSFSVHNPANALELTKVADCSGEDVERAITAADQALASWRSKTAKQRSVILRRWYDLFMLYQKDLAQILTAEQGKPLSEAMAEIAYGASYIEWFSEEAKRTYGDVIAPPSGDKRILVIKQPVGVVAAITPWNFPCAMLARKAAAALAAGCTLVAKPATETPLTALAMAYLAESAGIPSGVFNVVCSTDAKTVGQILNGSSRVRKVSFTGSTAVGKTLVQQSAQYLQRTSLELGGNAPFIVFDDADLSAAVEGAMASKFRNAGQTCVCANRFLVHSSVYDAFIEQFAKAIETLKVAQGTAEKVDMGPLINQRAVEKVQALVDQAKDLGSQVVLGGDAFEVEHLGPNFYPPTLLSHVSVEADIFKTEIFGPVAAVYRFETDAEALALANNSPYGLAAYFYTVDMRRVWRLSEALEYGMVGVNEGIISNEMAPFGGVKESGSGREGSKYGLDDFLDVKYVCLGGL